ncbi:MAG: SIS domain-containing protein [Chloroflexi bacterium]|nr:SIS domain-containing protein [Chloroflexota bacterium]
MYDNLPADVRTRHPFHMYDEIKAQPDAVARSLRLVEERGAGAVALLARARRVWVTGCGTSFHAACLGAWSLQAFSRGKVDARAVEAYELVTYQPGLRPDDVLLAVTHSGTTAMTLRALERAHRCGLETVVVTGFPQSPAGRAARQVVPTGYAEERSWAHTASYTAALATLAALANALAEPEERLDLSPLPAAVTEALQLEEMVHRLAAGAILAERYREPTQVIVVGGGLNAVTAREATLKLLETAYIPATAWELEEMLHGPLAAVGPDTLLILAAPTGSSTPRALDLVRAAREIGSTSVVLAGEENAGAFEHAHRLVLPDVPEVLSPIPCVVPLQLFSYFLAVGKDVNPDLLHRDDERYRRARAQYE